MSMTSEESRHVLDGCRPVPLASYLKSLAVLRLVSRQADPGARGAFLEDRFVLRTRLSRSELMRFFLDRYQPTPIVAPWNGGSGFYPGDNQVAIRRIMTSTVPRFERYRKGIEVAAAALRTLGVERKPAEEKPRLLALCRATFPDDALEWLDAALVLTSEGAKYPPLLGTGGNDGRLDFTNNFMQRVGDVIDPSTGEARPGAAELLEAACFDQVADGLVSNSIGQFAPGAAGGANASSGFSGDPCFNPWDFVLMLEGAIAFAVATSRRIQSSDGNVLSAPFTVRTSSVGYASASAADESASRGEMWLPLWERFASYAEIQTLFAEGRASVGKRQVNNGVDFARAVASLGIDRGIDSLQRYGFQVRNGLAYLATPLDRWPVVMRTNAHLLDGLLDAWLSNFRSKARAETAPSAVARASRVLDAAILSMCRDDRANHVQDVLVALGAVERALAQSLAWSRESFVRPVPQLNPEWLERADDGSPEYRLAASLASVVAIDLRGVSSRPLRSQVEPVDLGPTLTTPAWLSEVNRDIAWTDGDIVASMAAVLLRRVLQAERAGAEYWPDGAGERVILADLGDIADFIEQRLDDARVERLLHGALLTRSSRRCQIARRERHSEPVPPAAYDLLKLCFAGTKVRDRSVPIVRQIARLAVAGRGSDAVSAAIRRLRACDHVPVARSLFLEGSVAQRIAAALLFPIASGDVESICRRALRASECAVTAGTVNEE